MSTITKVQPEPKRNSIFKDIAISAGTTVAGTALGVGIGYFIPPTADKYAKYVISAEKEECNAYIKFIEAKMADFKTATKKTQKQIKKTLKSIKKGLKQQGVKFKSFCSPDELANDIKKFFKDRIKSLDSKKIKEQFKEDFKTLNVDEKEAFKSILRKGNICKWGIIGGCVALILNTIIGIYTQRKNRTAITNNG